MHHNINIISVVYLWGGMNVLVVMSQKPPVWHVILLQEFPEKTRPISFKHPLFTCPDMSPSSSVPTSGRLV